MAFNGYIGCNLIINRFASILIKNVGKKSLKIITQKMWPNGHLRPKIASATCR